MTAIVEWSTQPAAASLVRDLVDAFVADNGFARVLRDRLLSETGTRLVDWVARVELPANDPFGGRLAAAGFADAGGDGVWTHAGGLFPAVALGAGDERRLFVEAESVADFVLAHRLMGDVAIEGDLVASVRRARVAAENGAEVWVLERHGVRHATPEAHAADPWLVLRHAEAFRLRRRAWPDDAAGFDHALSLVRAANADLGVGRACDLFFAAEREFWQSRNRAARVQKGRQDALGMGWANHDHHTYRSSREHFARLVGVLEEMGFVCRERFYAGRDAGWGAQVLEQPDPGVVVFADVDLSADEVAGDFAHDPLPPRAELGTVGLWCALHGEAFLQAGMHHLECRFDFDAAREQLRALGVDSMKPFTDFPFLKQAFTKGDVWPVAADRLAALQAAGRVTAEQAAKFAANGALGSHLEVLQRDDGYKGFNQTGINEIIRGTDPRRQTTA